MWVGASLSRLRCGVGTCERVLARRGSGSVRRCDSGLVWTGILPNSSARVGSVGNTVVSPPMVLVLRRPIYSSAHGPTEKSTARVRTSAGYPLACHCFATRWPRVTEQRRRQAVADEQERTAGGVVMGGSGLFCDCAEVVCHRGTSLMYSMGCVQVSLISDGSGRPWHGGGCCGLGRVYLSRCRQSP